MSAFGTKRTFETEFRCPLLGVKQTSDGRTPMSAFDPKRTLVIGCPLFRLDAGRLNDRPPLLDFRLLVGAKRLRRLLFARRNFKALGFKFLTDVWIAQRIHGRSIELVDDVPRGIVRGKQRRP